jgi:hypothetical protein
MFIVVELQRSAEGQVGNIVTAHATQAEAESKYHQVLSSAAISNLPCHSAVLLSEEGFPIEHKAYLHTA